MEAQHAGDAMPGVRLHLGDCLEVLRTLPAASVDAVVTDPPAGIAFMGKGWDDFRRSRATFLDFLTPRLAECLRVAKPGARMLCWAIPRTSHWTGTAIEDAGWIIEERLAHVFGQGFPKAKSKLKPAVEDWWLARKPGGKVPDLNIEACRVGTDAIKVNGWKCGGEQVYNGRQSDGFDGGTHSGRYPPHLLLSHHAGCRPVGTTRVKGSNFVSNGTPRPHGQCYQAVGSTRDSVGYADADGLETVAAWACVAGCPVRALDAMTAHLHKAGNRGGTPRTGAGYSGGWGDGTTMQPGYDDSDVGASRFFPQFTPADDLDFPGLYCPKASRADRGAGNTHPCVKPQALMRWLCRLICPPGGTVVDPFLGSGTTLLACLAEGFGGIGIESDPESFALAEQRIAAARGKFASEPTHEPA